MYNWLLAVDPADTIVPAWKTKSLQALFTDSQLLSHNEGKLSNPKGHETP